MINSNLALRLQSARPKAIEPIAAQKFLANVNDVNSNQDVGMVLKRVAMKISRTPQAFDGNENIDSARADIDDEDEKKMFFLPRQPYITEKGTGVIPIEGVIGKNLSVMEKCLGCTDINDVVAALKSYEKDARVERVVFKFNSGGGTTTGLEELSKRIFNFTKPTVSFTDEDMGSAAYWLGSQANRVVVTPSSSVVSCGIYVSICDESEHYKECGKKVVVIKSGDYKGAGVDGTSLSPKQEKWVQGEVDELHGRFIRDILRARPFVNLEDLQGQSFYGDVAAARGLVTGVVDSFDELMEQLEGPTGQTVIGGVSMVKGSPTPSLPYVSGLR
jgi:hypothetical protein